LKRNLSNSLQNLLAKTDSSDTFGITLFSQAVTDKLILLERYPRRLFVEFGEGVPSGKSGNGYRLPVLGRDSGSFWVADMCCFYLC
jgi:hypothetical protein